MSAITIPVIAKRFYAFMFGPPKPRKYPPVDSAAYSKISNFRAMALPMIIFITMSELALVIGILIVMGGMAALSNGPDIGAQNIGIVAVVCIMLGAAGLAGMFASMIGLIIISWRDRRRGLVVPRMTPEQILNKYGYPCSRVYIDPPVPNMIPSSAARNKEIPNG